MVNQYDLMFDEIPADQTGNCRRSPAGKRCDILIFTFLVLHFLSLLCTLYTPYFYVSGCNYWANKKCSKYQTNLNESYWVARLKPIWGPKTGTVCAFLYLPIFMIRNEKIICILFDWWRYVCIKPPLSWLHDCSELLAESVSKSALLVGASVRIARIYAHTHTTKISWKFYHAPYSTKHSRIPSRHQLAYSSRSHSSTMWSGWRCSNRSSALLHFNCDCVLCPCLMIAYRW